MSSNKNVSEWLNSHRILKESSKEENLKRKAKTISITSGKGGVGKTSISLKLGKMLAEDGKKVLIIDCDFNLSNTAVKLGIPLNDNFYSLISAQKTFDECLYKDGNFHLLTSCNGSLELFEKGTRADSLVIDIVSSHEQDYDFILLDCAAGITKEILNLNAYCDERLVVVTPDKSSITDAYSLMKILKNKYGISKNKLLVNKVSNNLQYQRLVKSLSETVENFLSARLSILGGLQLEATSVDHFDRLIFFEKKSKFHKDFSKVVKKVSEEDDGNVTSVINSEVPFVPNDDFGQDVQQTV